MEKTQVIRGMADGAYHAIDGASASRLKALRRSPAHMVSMNSGARSPALEFGTAFHTAILEPFRFDELYYAAPEGIDRRTTAGKAAYQMMLDTNIGKTCLSAADMAAIRGMSMGVESHPAANDMIKSRTETEISLFWESLGCPCKARIDAYSLEHRAIIDLKSTQDASPEAFARSVAQFGYHIQAAWYMSAMRLAGFDVETMVFIAVEKSEPYGTACYMLDDQAIAEGEREIARLMPMYANCHATQIWHGYDPTIQTIHLPRWAIRAEEESL